MKNFTEMFNKIGLSLLSMPLYVYDYIFCVQALIFKQKYITRDNMLPSSEKCFKLESSTLVSYLWLNTTYIIINFYCTILFCDRFIVQHTALSQMGPYMDFLICMKSYNLA